MDLRLLLFFCVVSAAKLNSGSRERICFETDEPLAIEDSCLRYKSCINGLLTEKTCPEGLLFDTATLQCVPPEYANCNSVNEGMSPYVNTLVIFKSSKIYKDNSNTGPTTSIEPVLNRSTEFDTSKPGDTADIDNTESITKVELDSAEFTNSAEIDNTESITKAELNSAKFTNSAEIDNTESITKAELDSAEITNTAEIDNTESITKAELDSAEYTNTAEIDNKEHVTAKPLTTESTMTANVNIGYYPAKLDMTNFKNIFDSSGYNTTPKPNSKSINNADMDNTGSMTTTESTSLTIPKPSSKSSRISYITLNIPSTIGINDNRSSAICIFNPYRPLNFIRDPSSCQHYYVCKYGQLIHYYSCPIGYSFSSYYKTCVPRWYNHCRVYEWNYFPH